MVKDWQENLEKAVDALLQSNDRAISFFTRKDLLGESVGPVSQA
jgi:hypothetical protein